MNKLTKNKSFDIKWIILFWFFFFITDSGVINYVRWGYYTRIVCLLALGVIGLYLMLKSNVHIDAVLFFAIILIVFSCFINANGPSSMAYVAILPFAFYFSKVVTFDKFCDVYLQTMRIIAISSLILYFALLLLPQLANVLPIMEYTENLSYTVEYHELFITHLPVEQYTYRNYGIFWEPGTYQVFLNIALLIAFFFKPSNLKWDFILFTTAIVTTFSTMGYIAFMIVMASAFFSHKLNFSKKLLFFVAFIIILMVALFVYGNELYEYVFFKFDEGNEHGSFVSRFYSVIGNIIMTMRSPIYGWGYANHMDTLNEIFEELHLPNIHQTNTLLNYFASFGVFVGGFFTSLFVKLSKSIGKTPFLSFLIFISLIITTSGENLIGSVMLNILLFYGLNHKTEDLKGNI